MKPSEAILEAVPTICMDDTIHYALGVSKKTITLGLLTDRKISRYQKLGWYRAQGRAAWQQSGNRLVYSA
jgi:hypothetical protein